MKTILPINPQNSIIPALQPNDLGGYSLRNDGQAIAVPFEKKIETLHPSLLPHSLPSPPFPHLSLPFPFPSPLTSSL